MRSLGPQTEADWEAESDARTLLEAEAIKADEKRFVAAQKKVEEMKKELEAKAAAARAIAGAKMVYSVGNPTT